MGTGAASYPAAPGVRQRVWNTRAAVPLSEPPRRKDLLHSSTFRPSPLGLTQARGGDLGSPSAGGKKRAGGARGHRPPPPGASRRPRDPPTSVQAQGEGKRPAGAEPRAQRVRPGRLPSPPGPRRSGPEPPPPPFPARQEAAAAAPGAARAGPGPPLRALLTFWMAAGVISPLPRCLGAANATDMSGGCREPPRPLPPVRARAPRTQQRRRSGKNAARGGAGARARWDGPSPSRRGKGLRRTGRSSLLFPLARGRLDETVAAPHGPAKTTGPRADPEPLRK